MRQEKGITTASVIVYVIIITVAISLLTVVTGYFRNILSKNLKQDKDYEKYITFASYFVQDVQEKGNKVVEIANLGDHNYVERSIYYIKFSNNNAYKFTVKDKTLYRNDRLICDKVDLCRFSKEEENGKTKVKVEFLVGKFDKTEENCLVFYM